MDLIPLFVGSTHQTLQSTEMTGENGSSWTALTNFSGTTLSLQLESRAWCTPIHASERSPCLADPPGLRNGHPQAHLGRRPGPRRYQGRGPPRAHRVRETCQKDKRSQVHQISTGRNHRVYALASSRSEMA